MRRMIIAIAGGAVALVLATATPGLAATDINVSTPITLSVFVPCANGGAGEIVDLSGPLHVLVTETISGNNISGEQHFQPQGISGTGETTGAKYQATGVTSSSFKVSLQNGQATETLINRFDIIGQGSGNNFSVHETAHLTFNASGTLTVFFDNFSETCS